MYHVLRFLIERRPHHGYSFEKPLELFISLMSWHSIWIQYVESFNVFMKLFNDGEHGWPPLRFFAFA